MTIHPFETLDRLRLRMAEAIISQSGLRHPVLADHLRRTLGASAGDGALIPPPVLEGAFPFIAATETLGSLAGRVLDSRTVDALAGDDTGQGYSFPRSRFPYLHQLDAWKILTAHDPKSVVVTAGTGSGKTECFLVPLLDSLYRRDERVAGVEAIMLYPLNTLIASQQERLDAWTRGARGRIRYCLYNGNLDEGLDARRLKESLATEPQKVPDRKTLRTEPPPVLVTNPTMLEYMLVRPQDRPILDASRGCLKWIILDEAHTLVGSAAAETALLLRRTMEAFEVDPKDVRFVATSATIGEGPDVKHQLRRFLAAIGGIDISQVDVVSGARRLPQRPRASIGAPDAKAIAALPPQALYERLGGYAPIWSLIEDLKSGSAPAAKFDEIAGTIGVSGETLAMALTRAKSPLGEILAPLRVHSFHRAMPGLWCCTNPACPDAMGEGWGAGKILFRRQENCPACNMPVAELFTCNECGTAFMMTEEIGDRLIPPRPKPPTDEFVFEADRDSSPENDEEAELVPLDGPSVSHCFSLSSNEVQRLMTGRRG